MDSHLVDLLVITQKCPSVLYFSLPSFPSDFCCRDLLGAQAGVLEHNVSVEVAVRYKRAAHADIATLADLVGLYLPELDEQACWKVSGLAVVTIGTLWTHSQPSASLLAAYRSDSALAALRPDFTETVEETLAILLSGVLSRAGT